MPTPPPKKSDALAVFNVINKVKAVILAKCDIFIYVKKKWGWLKKERERKIEGRGKKERDSLF
jgi:hypothetical protein